MPVATSSFMRLDRSQPTGRFMKTELGERRSTRLVFERLYGLSWLRNWFGHTLNFILRTF